MFRTLCLCLLMLARCAVGCALVQGATSDQHHLTVSNRERAAWVTPGHTSVFNELSRVNARWNCEETRPPQALATPDPLLSPAGSGLTVKVNFIIGTDGIVHSPLILQSAGAVGDRSILRTIRTWRYRPATCNGVPTEAEGNIVFFPPLRFNALGLK